MSCYVTKAMRANMAAGLCVRCGAFEQYRNSAGECNSCHNKGYDERRAARKAQLAALPRCIACKTRASYRALGINLCGRHLNMAKARLENGLGIFGIVQPVFPQDIFRVLGVSQ